MTERVVNELELIDIDHRHVDVVVRRGIGNDLLTSFEEPAAVEDVGEIVGLPDTQARLAVSIVSSRRPNSKTAADAMNALMKKAVIVAWVSVSGEVGSTVATTSSSETTTHTAVMRMTRPRVSGLAMRAEQRALSDA
ncbi:MAG: hypothetical protein R2706_21200 [Acidimicrobiales bacterium]